MKNRWWWWWTRPGWDHVTEWGRVDLEIKQQLLAASLRFVCPYLQMADWLYAGPSAALSAWPTWVCVRPRDSRRILNALANSRISSRLTPSTSLGAVCGSTAQQTNLILLALRSAVADHIFQSEWSKRRAIRQRDHFQTALKIFLLQVTAYYILLPLCCKLHVPERCPEE